MKNGDRKKVLKERMKAGRHMRKAHEKALKTADKHIEDAFHFMGDGEKARKLVPGAFDQKQLEEKAIADIDRQLEQLDAELSTLKD